MVVYKINDVVNELLEGKGTMGITFIAAYM